MRRILIVDDEQPVASGIAHLVRRDFSPDFEIAGLAGSGREAIDRVGQLSPDIILMDVRMPGFSGLEAIRELRKRGSGAAFIMITAFERFEIAREAIELGVVDYLLKPVSTEALAASLSVAVSYLERREELERAKLELSECAERSRLFAENALLFGVMAGAGPGGDVAAYKSVLGVQGDSMIAIAMSLPRGAVAAGRAPETDDLYQKIWKAIKYKTDFLLSPPVSGLCMLLAPVRAPLSSPLSSPQSAPRSAPRSGESEANGIVLQLESILAKLEAAPSEVSRIIFGRGSVRPYAEACASWSEAVIDLSRRRARLVSGTVPPSAPERPAVDESPDFQSIESALEDALLEGASLDLKLALDRYAGARAPGSVPEPAEVCSMIALVGKALRAMHRDGRIDAREESSLMAMNDLYAAADFSAFLAALRARFAGISEALRESAPAHSPAVAAAMSYVRRHYAEPINLDRVSDGIGISAGRLSRLFVEETGGGFSRYLIVYRLDKAKELLAKPGASIKEVSVACGYPDQNYFARLFKKVTGLTPSEFIPATTEGHNEAR